MKCFISSLKKIWNRSLRRIAATLSPCGRLIRKYGLFAALAFLAACTLAAAVIYFRTWYIPDPEGILVEIPRGSPLPRIAALLESNGVIPGRGAWIFCVKGLGVSEKLQAGQYCFKGGQSNYSVIRVLRRGEQVRRTLVIPEGSTSRRIAQILSREMGFPTDSVLIMVRDTVICRQLQVPAASLEGFLYPDTYQFAAQTGIRDVLSVMVRRFQSLFHDSLESRMNDLNLTLNETVTLASIIEGEAMQDAEKPVISSLYHNRLRIGMALQADPTIQYIIKDGPRRLLTRDLSIDSPYNTYRYRGLPPGPVNNPGLPSILAALYPAMTQYLYMVAAGDGSHVFSTSLEEHAKAKRRFDRIRRSYSRNRR
jgi:UPF0755 protein